MIKENLNLLFDFFLPRICLVCKNKILNSDKILCSDCFNKLEIAQHDRLDFEFERKFLSDKIVHDFQAAFVFQENTPIRQIIHEFKYEDKFIIGKYLGIKVSELLREKIVNWKADIITEVPLHSLRKAERGYNQAEIIAMEIGKRIGIKFNGNILKRIKFTETQTKLNLTDRRENIKDAFKLKKQKLVKNKNIILVDDVITTGATISECAKVLKDNGAKNIYALSVAIAD